MWAQPMVLRLRPGREDDLSRRYEQLHATEQPGSGLLRTIGALDQKDPGRVSHLVLFESEEKARERERDPRRQEALADVRALMAEVFDGPRPSSSTCRWSTTGCTDLTRW